MNNVWSKKVWITGTALPHVEPPSIPLIQETHNGNSDKDFVKLKLCRDPTLSTLDLYDFKIYLFDNGDPEEFLLFVRNLNMTLAASGTLEVGTKYQYLQTLVHGEALCQFKLLSAEVEITQTLNIEDIIKGLSQYFPPVYLLTKKRAMHRGMKNLAR